MDTRSSSTSRSRPSMWRRWPATTVAGLTVLTSVAVVAVTATSEPAPEPMAFELPDDVDPVDELDVADEEAPATHHKGEEGKMGKPTSRSKAGLYAMKGPKDAVPAPAFAVGSDDADVWGGLTGTEIGEAYGVGGLGLVGTGRGGGGTGSIGLGGGTGEGYGRGSGAGFGGRMAKAEPVGKYDGSIQSHQLTAGTVDDNADPKAYEKALARLREARRELDVDESLWRLDPPKRRHAALPGALDIALVIDTTGSMGDELEYLKVELREIAAKIGREFPGVEQRWGLVVYRDQGDDYVARRIDFRSIDRFIEALGHQSAGGGGDMPEAMDTALALSTELAWRRDDNTARMVFLVADAPTHSGGPARRFADAVLDHRQAKTAIFSVAGSGVDMAAEAQLRAAARATGGQYIFLTDHSGVGGHHAAPQVEQFKVETLHDAITRMIRGELGDAGKPREPAAPAPTPAPDPTPEPTPEPTPAPTPTLEPPPSVTVSLADLAPPPAAPSFWDDFKRNLAEHLQLASTLALVLFAGIGIDTTLARRRRARERA